jgi:hypothetical protein
MSLLLQVQDDWSIFITDYGHGAAVCFSPYNYVVISYATSNGTARFLEEYDTYVWDWGAGQKPQWELIGRNNFATKVISKIACFRRSDTPID